MNDIVLLVNLPFPFSRHNVLTEVKDYPEHLGLESLASVLRAGGIPVKLLDAQTQGIGIGELVDEIINNEYKLVGFSLFHFSVNLLGEICSRIKEKNNKIHLTCGGHFVTAAYEPVLERFADLDSVIRGEGELILPELAQMVINGGDWRQVPGLSYKSDGKVCLSPERKLIENLDDLPFPDRDFLDMKLARGEKINTINIYSSRGCYGTCKFCSIKTFYGKKGPSWRGRSAVNVVDELEYLRDKYRPSKFMFVDDNFIGIGKRGKVRALEIAREIIRRNLNIKFMISCRVDDIDPKLFTLLMKAGLKEVFLGIESFSQSELNFFNKFVQYEDNCRALEFLKSMKLNLSPGFIMFTPYTRLEDITKNIKFLVKYNLIDIGKFNHILRVVGSRFDQDDTPGMHKEGFDMFNFGLYQRPAYNFFDFKTRKLVDIMYKDHWNLKAFVILERCKRFEMRRPLFIENNVYKHYHEYIEIIERRSIDIDVQYVMDIISVLNCFDPEVWGENIKKLQDNWRRKNKAIRSFLRKALKMFPACDNLKLMPNPDMGTLMEETELISSFFIKKASMSESWDMRKCEVPDILTVQKLVKELAVRNIFKLQILCDDFNDKIAGILKETEGVMQYVELQLNFDEKHLWMNYIDKVDHFIFRISGQELLTQLQEIKQIHNELNLKMPVPPAFIVYQCDAGLFDKLKALQLPFDIILHVHGKKGVAF